jgi:hypothetical protein
MSIHLLTFDATASFVSYLAREQVYNFVVPSPSAHC